MSVELSSFRFSRENMLSIMSLPVSKAEGIQATEMTGTKIKHLYNIKTQEMIRTGGIRHPVDGDSTFWINTSFVFFMCVDVVDCILHWWSDRV